MQLHYHTLLIVCDNDIVITGIIDIILNNNSTLEYNQISITVHLTGKKVLGLMINSEKTGRRLEDILLVLMSCLVL